MKKREFFPLGIATGSAFCNRHDETKLLMNNIKNCKHTLLMAPRRYGKTSLALHAVGLSKFPATEIDFYMARNEKVIENYILNGVIELIGKTLDPIEKLIASIKKYVKTLKPKLNIGINNVSLELNAEIDSDSATNVKEALLLLERLLSDQKKYAVLLLDEFQNVGVIAKGMGIEGAIRHVAQKTKHLMFIFSGSNRKLLQTMFEDDTRPLYKLCWKLVLGRISDEHYKNYILKAARLYWNASLDDKSIEKILMVTERHPYYVNKLGDRLWAYCDKPFSVKEVNQVWAEILEEEKSEVVKEISLLPVGQKNVLLYLCRGKLTGITSKDAILSLQMTSSSIITALNGLEEKDIIEKIKLSYNVINPVQKYYVLKGEVR